MLNTLSTNNINKTPSLLSSLSSSKSYVARTSEPNLVQLSNNNKNNNNNSPRPNNASIGGALSTSKLYGDGGAAVTRARQTRCRLLDLGGILGHTSTDKEQSVAVKATISVKPTVVGTVTNVGVGRGIDNVSDLLGRSISLELVSVDAEGAPTKIKQEVVANKVK